MDAILFWAYQQACNTTGITPDRVWFEAYVRFVKKAFLDWMKQGI